MPVGSGEAASQRWELQLGFKVRARLDRSTAWGEKIILTGVDQIIKIVELRILVYLRTSKQPYFYEMRVFKKEQCVKSLQKNKLRTDWGVT